jgi:hypothetical protein
MSTFLLNYSSSLLSFKKVIYLPNINFNLGNRFKYLFILIIIFVWRAKCNKYIIAWRSPSSSQFKFTREFLYAWSIWSFYHAKEKSLSFVPAVSFGCSSATACGRHWGNFSPVFSLVWIAGVPWQFCQSPSSLFLLPFHFSWFCYPCYPFTLI